MSLVGCCGNTCTALVAVQAVDVSKKVFSCRQNKLVKIKSGLQHVSCFCAGRCSPPEFVSAPDDSWFSLKALGFLMCVRGGLPGDGFVGRGEVSILFCFLQHQCICPFGVHLAGI